MEKAKIQPTRGCDGGTLGSTNRDVIKVLRLPSSAILTLMAVMRSEDKEALMYLMTRSIGGFVVARGEMRLWHRRNSLGEAHCLR